MHCTTLLLAAFAVAVGANTIPLDRSPANLNSPNLATRQEDVSLL